MRGFRRSGNPGVRDGPFDLAVSLFSLQAINDLPGALIQIRRLLKPDGLFLAALFGGATLSELRQSFAAAESEIWAASVPRVAPFADVRDMGGAAAARRLRAAGRRCRAADACAIPISPPWCGTCAPMARPMCCAERRKTFLGRDTLAALMRPLCRRITARDGKLIATFETLYLTGWAPHESQQQPLKPGSAKARLSDALGP